MAKNYNADIAFKSASAGLSSLFDFLHDKAPLASFALYRLPGHGTDYNFIGSGKNPTVTPITQLDDLKSGFVLANFNGDVYHISPEIEWNSKENAEIEPSHSTPAGNSLPFNYNEGIDDFAFAESEDKKNTEEYRSLVNSCLEFIKRGNAFKLVPARRKIVNASLFNRLHILFEELCSAYPNAFISLTSSPLTGTWIGASPELLVSTEGHVFKTVAVAGTQRYLGQELHTVAWTQKEIEEQAMVSRYIINCFKKIRLREFEEEGPKSVVAGNLVHLKTEFEVDMNATGFSELGTVMLKLLHPTSAVCGMPLEVSKEFLQKHENFDRKLFSGFLGPINQNGLSALYVNIRCMEVHSNYAVLYAGAGTTQYSDADKEVDETTHKMATILDILQIS